VRVLVENVSRDQRRLPRYLEEGGGVTTTNFLDKRVATEVYLDGGGGWRRPILLSERGHNFFLASDYA